MGDVGSAFLGYTLAAMPLLAGGSARRSGWLFLAALTFLWLFFVDTVYTFTRRALRGEKVWLAHREHLYQRLVIAGASHSGVTFIYVVLTLVISAVFISVFRFRGSVGLLLLFSYLASAFLVLIAAHRKKH
jgi:UDP-N-acetylmuramyl pentapeptide phosphotransferase/UDP-N-acetylglucosamine-1-phosphate transferase